MKWLQLTIRGTGVTIYVKIDAISVVTPVASESDLLVDGITFQTTASPAQIRNVILGRPHNLTVLS